MGTSLDELLNAEFKEAFDEFDKVSTENTQVLTINIKAKLFSDNF